MRVATAGPTPESGGRRSGGVGGGARRLGVEVLERAGFDATALDERVDFLLLQSDHSPEAVGGKQSFVDEPVERAIRDAEPLGGGRGREPSDLFAVGPDVVGGGCSSVTVMTVMVRRVWRVSVDFDTFSCGLARGLQIGPFQAERAPELG